MNGRPEGEIDAPDRDGPPDWALRDRLAWVGRFERLVAARRDDLCRLMTDELGKAQFEGLTSDVMPVLAACRWLRRRAPGLLRARRVGGRTWFQLGQRLEVRREPVGTVAIIATWNYPVQLLGIQLVQALAAGNRVVVKPSENSARTQVALLELAMQAGMPAGALRWVEPTREAGPRLLRSERLDHVVFTGSTRVGREVAAWAAQTLTPSTLELSGRDSALVLADADPRLAARSIWNGVVTNAGQTCMAPRRALVDERVYAPFLAALAPLAGGARPVRLVSEDAAAHVFELATKAVAAGGRSLSGVLEAPPSSDPRWLRPLAIADCPENADLVAGDHFGPAIAVVPVRDLAAALEIHRRCTQHLATSVFTRRPRRWRGLAGELGSTNVLFNDCLLPIGHPGAAIGGHAESGWGVSRGAAGLLAMTRPVYVSTTGSVIRTPLSPPTSSLVRTMSRVTGWWYGAGRAPDTATAPTQADEARADQVRAANAGRANGAVYTSAPERIRDQTGTPSW